MSLIRRAVLPAALLLVAAAAPASAHLGDPDYRSVVREIVPPTDGLTAQVLDHDDTLLVVNGSERTVTILDEDGEPFARLLANGTVQVDAEWAAKQAAEEAAEAQEEPAGMGAVGDGALLAHAGEHHEPDAIGPGRGGDAAGTAGVRWRTLDGTGRFRWHDPRISYRGSGVPPQVTDRTEETKVGDWRVPIRVGAAPGAILGTLTWVGEPDAGASFPTAAVVSIAALVLLGGGAVLLVRRRRAGVAG